MRPSRFLVPVVIGLFAIGCSRPSLGAKNDSASAYYLRISDPDNVRVYAIDPNDGGVAIGRVAERTATIELLSSTCEVLGSWTSSSGGFVAIDRGGTARFTPGPDRGLGIAADSDVLKQVYDC